MIQRIPHYCLILFTIFQLTCSQRRIKDGKEVKSDKRYVVYLVKAPSAPNQYHGWLCGGAIISKDYVVTSAACVQDVQHIYVVPGYKKYVSAEMLDSDECVREKKKKVVLTCVPRNYRLDYNRTEVWARIDIAVIKVESSFDFTDKSYTKICSYTPQAIEFNTEKEFPKPGDDVIVLGWGHSKQFRKDDDLVDLNLPTLHYAPTRVLEEEICVTYYDGNKELASFIESSMLCTLEPGNLDDKGELILRSPPIVQGCITEAARMRGAVGRMCEDEQRAEAMVYDGGLEEIYEDPGGELILVNGTRKQMNNIKKRQLHKSKENKKTNITEERISGTNRTNILKKIDKNKEITKNVKMPQRRNDEEDRMAYYDFDQVPRQGNLGLDGEDTPGICQNDHGGPLIAWRGGQEVLVAVATLYKLDNRKRCRGPYLFTKTWCNGAFLKCIVDQEPPDATRRHCDEPDEVGFEIVRRHISWVGHRDGPAENERIQIRHQVPLSVFHKKSMPLSNYPDVL